MMLSFTVDSILSTSYNKKIENKTIEYSTTYQAQAPKDQNFEDGTTGISSRAHQLSKNQIFKDGIYTPLSIPCRNIKKKESEDIARNPKDETLKDQIFKDGTIRIFKDRTCKHDANKIKSNEILLSNQQLFLCKPQFCKLSSEMPRNEMHQQHNQQQHSNRLNLRNVTKSLSISKYGTSVTNNTHFGSVSVTLQNFELWNMFRKVGTEMVITKSGR